MLRTPARAGQNISEWAKKQACRRQAFEAATDPAVRGQLDAAAREAQRFGVDSTPSFVLARAGAEPRRLSPSALSVDQFAGPIEAALRTQ